MSLDQVKQIADAVLYEGYMLYPYRASAVKNRQRFNFGVLFPRGYCAANPGAEAWVMRTECLVEGDQPVIDARVRCLHLVAREAERLLEPVGADGSAGTAKYEPVFSLEVDGQSYQSWQEAVERETAAPDVSLNECLASAKRLSFEFEPDEQIEPICDSHGRAAGRFVRRQRPLSVEMTIAAEAVAPNVHRVKVEIRNVTPWRDESAHAREDAMLDSLISTHTILSVRGGQFVSSLDPPPLLADAVAACQNVGAWPVLVGDEGERDVMLSSPIILYDYPQIAPESGGSFFDGTEIDEILALRIMTLTDEEKREMRSVDARAREILARTESMPPEQWEKMHGAIRGLKVTTSPGS